jgi:two-component system cell cycle response regulator CtrA
MDEVVELRREVQALRDALEAMRSSLESEPGLKLIQIAHLTHTERLLLGILIRRRRVTKDQLMTALYCHRPDNEPCAKIIDTYICKIRKKLKPHGIEIKTVWCAGYEIPLDSIERIKAMIAAADGSALGPEGCSATNRFDQSS